MNGNLFEQLIHYYQTNSGYLWDCLLIISNVNVWCIICVNYRYSFGIIIARFGKLSGVIITLANIIQTVPVIAMLAMLMLVIGLGINTVILQYSCMLYFQL